MTWNITILLNNPWPYLATATFAVLVGLYARKQPRRPGSRYFAALTGVWLIWALAAGFQTVLKSLDLQYDMMMLESVCALSVAPLEFMIILVYTGNEKWLTRRHLLLLAFPALLLTLMVFTMPRSSMVSLESRSGIDVFVGRDLLRWGFFTYVLILLLVAVGVLFSCLLRAPAFRVPTLLLIFGQIIPPFGYAVLDPHWFTVPPIQVAILLTNFTILAYFVALYNFRLLRVIPVARDTVIDSMPYGMIVLDAENRLVGFNTAARELPALPGKLVLRQDASKVLGDWWERIAPLIGPDPVSQDVIIQTIAVERIFRVMSQPLLQTSGWRMGQVFVLEDVTQTRQAQQQQAQTLWAQATLQEREQLAHELHDGLSQSLAFLNLQAQAAQVQMQAGQSQAANDSLTRLTEAGREIQEDAREMISHLLTVSLPAENFCTTLRLILSTFERRTGLAIHLKMDRNVEAFCNPTRLIPPVAIQLTRITQEALANVRKHARGTSQVNLDLRARDGQLLLTITDDGSGFDPAARQTDGKHFGLQVMRQRAARIGGQVLVDSAPGKGTRIEVCTPLAGDDYG